MTDQKVAAVSLSLVLSLFVILAVELVLPNRHVSKQSQIACVQSRVMQEGLFMRDMRCEKWSDGKTRADLGLKD